MKTADIKVELLDSMGSDLSVVNAARVSMNKHHDTFAEGDAQLIKYLVEHKHWTPMAHCFASFRVKAPIFVARQLVKHQVGLAWNEVSRRYVDEEPEFWFPDVWRRRPEGNIKQGSGGDLPYQELWHQYSSVVCGSALSWYNAAIRNGMAPEQARLLLPLNTMTEWIWSGSLAAWARVCNLRLDSHAQKETADVAAFIDSAMREVFPVSWAELVK